jgi:hypothetical protein
MLEGVVYIELYTYKLTNAYVTSLRPPHREKIRNEGPTKKLDGRTHYTFEAIAPTGEPKLPKKAADVFKKQCGVLVRDLVPITVQE